VEPIVVVNGSEDMTAQVARSYGAVVLESSEGKMPALQAGLGYLGRRALEPLLILDADSRPLINKLSPCLVRAIVSLPNNQPAIVWGPYIFKGEINPLLGATLSGSSMMVSWQDRHRERPRTIRGGNTGLHIKSSQLLKELLELDNFWPRADVAIFDSVRQNQGEYSVVFKPDGWVLTSGKRISKMLKKIVFERQHPSLVTDATYAAEAPAGSRAYHSATTATIKH